MRVRDYVGGQQSGVKDTYPPAVFAQPIVSRARPELLRSHFIPTIGRLRKRAGKVVAEEEQLRLEAKAEAEEGELLVRDEFSVLCRDLYALYPLLIRYVDNNRSAKPWPDSGILNCGLFQPHSSLSSPFSLLNPSELERWLSG